MVGNRITRCFRHGLAMNLAAPPRNPTISIVGGVKHGMTEKIKLEKNKWYKVEGEGNLTMSPVNVRVE